MKLFINTPDELKSTFSFSNDELKQMEKNIVTNQLCITMLLQNLANIKEGKENTPNYIAEIDK